MCAASGDPVIMPELTTTQQIRGSELGRAMLNALSVRGRPRRAASA